MRIRKVLKSGWTYLLFVALAVGGYFLIDYLARGTGQVGAQGSVEENWNRTIGSLGVVPIFPPEEDLVVGDVLALIIRDDDDDPEVDRNNANLSQKSFVSRTVKLTHIDVISDLEAAYSPLPVFPSGGTPPLRDSVARKFADGILQNNLPRAAFPKLKIQGVDNASGGIAGGANATGFGASNQELVEFELADVRTYGLGSVVALDILNRYCAAEKTQNVCTEATARKHLSRVAGVGDRINRQYFAKNGELKYAITVEIVMVYRVYLTNAIRDLRRASRARSGFFRAIWPFGSSSDEAPAGRAQEASGVPSGAATVEQVEALKKRIADIEGQLSKTRNGGALSFDSFFGSESSLEGKFERPVAIAYRSVKFDFADQTSKKAEP
jgi:hypothetical protein